MQAFNACCFCINIMWLRFVRSLNESQKYPCQHMHITHCVFPRELKFVHNENRMHAEKKSVKKISPSTTKAVSINFRVNCAFFFAFAPHLLVNFRYDFEVKRAAKWFFNCFHWFSFKKSDWITLECTIGNTLNRCFIVWD